jgi:hypothetical protein
MLRPARRPTGAEARGFLRRLVREIRSQWPRVEILIRADSHFCAPEVLDFCRAARIDFVLGVATSTTLRGHITALEESTAARQATRPGGSKLRRYKAFFRRRPELEPRRTHHRPRRGRTTGHRHPLHRDQPPR